MLVTRLGRFETNSSECHALLIPKEQEVCFTKTIDLSADTEQGDIFRKVIRDLRDRDAKVLANWFYRHGVEKIIYTGSNTEFIKAIESEKAEFEKDPNRDLGTPDSMDLYDFSDNDLMNLFFGTENRDYFGHDGYLYSDYKVDYAFIVLGGG